MEEMLSAQVSPLILSYGRRDESCKAQKSELHIDGLDGYHDPMLSGDPEGTSHI